jgi:ABC transporter substrate binding protein (PQQ-dependent alcohol dehydrogenase system)
MLAFNMFRILHIQFSLYLVMLLGIPAYAENLKIRILYAEQQLERPATLSGMHPIPSDQGWRGAELALADNNEGGKFTRDEYVFDKIIAPAGKSLSDEIRGHAEMLADYIIVNAPAAELLKLADLPEMKNKIIFNAGSRDENLREEDCRGNMFHTLPSRSMLTDSLAQFMLKKNWLKWLLLPGSKSNDHLFADALRNSASKFGLNIVAEKPWSLEGDMRETAATEIPIITQGSEYDVVMVADENDDFGSLISYNTDLPRPVAGTHGLVATGWSDVIEPWGAIQLQNRFVKLAGRGMNEIDFASWLVVRVVGEAVTRTNSSDLKTVRPYILSDEFKLAAFKGRAASFRTWNGQMRQVIHLVNKETQVATAPFDDFLHETNDLDTLGFDKPETKCKAFEVNAQ